MVAVLRPHAQREERHVRSPAVTGRGGAGAAALPRRVWGDERVSGREDVEAARRRACTSP